MQRFRCAELATELLISSKNQTTEKRIYRRELGMHRLLLCLSASIRKYNIRYMYHESPGGWNTVAVLFEQCMAAQTMGLLAIRWTDPRVRV